MSDLSDKCYTIVNRDQTNCATCQTLVNRYQTVSDKLRDCQTNVIQLLIAIRQIARLSDKC